MPAIVYQTNRKTGITYAYESHSYWDREKQQSRAKRKCIGKVDPASGQIVPTRKRKPPSQEEIPPAKPGPVPVTEANRFFAGATYLFDRIGEELGITADLKRCFPDTYRQILSVAYYLILEDPSPLYRFPKWARLHHHPWGHPIASQRSSELFASITEAAKEQFFRLQARRRAEREYWAYDITSISSCSDCLTQAKYGMNREHDPLLQLNLALVFGEQSNLPFYYRKLSGNIPDVKTLRHLLSELDFLSCRKVKLLMDRGFYSVDNINGLFAHHLKFLMAVQLRLKYIQLELEKVRETLRTFTNYSPAYDLYATSTTVTWQYTRERPYKKDQVRGKRRMYVHLYFNPARSSEDERRHNVLLTTLLEELESGKHNPQHESLYAKYFEVSSTPVRGMKIEAKQDVIDQARKNYGYFALISNEVKDPIEALELYRNKDLIEKAFGNLKERLNLRRTLVSSEESLDGKLFVVFVGLIYLSYVKKKMQEGNLFKKYTLQSLLDEFDVIECFERPGHQRRWGEMTKRQVELYSAMGVTPPSLQ